MKHTTAIKCTIGRGALYVKGNLRWPTFHLSGPVQMREAGGRCVCEKWGSDWITELKEVDLLPGEPRMIQAWLLSKRLPTGPSLACAYLLSLIVNITSSHYNVNSWTRNITTESQDVVSSTLFLWVLCQWLEFIDSCLSTINVSCETEAVDVVSGDRLYFLFDVKWRNVS